MASASRIALTVYAVFIRKHARDTHPQGSFNGKLEPVNHQDYEGKTTKWEGARNYLLKNDHLRSYGLKKLAFTE